MCGAFSIRPDVCLCVCPESGSTPMSDVSDILVDCICGQSFEVEASHEGEVFDCAKCGKELSVPDRKFAEKYRSIKKQIAESTDFVRARLYIELTKLGSPRVLPMLSEGLYDSSRTVVNTCLVQILVIGTYGRDHLIELMNTGALKIGRLVAAIRESGQMECVDELCDLIDAGLFGEGQVSQMIKLLGESERQRAIPTLKALRRAYPNLAMLVDNSLANYKHLDSGVNKIPDNARSMPDSDQLKGTLEKAASQHATQKKKGCAVLLFLLIFPALGLAGISCWQLAEWVLKA